MRKFNELKKLHKYTLNEKLKDDIFKNSHVGFIDLSL